MKRSVNIFFLTMGIGGFLRFLTGDLKDWVNLNIKDDVGSC